MAVQREQQVWQAPRLAQMALDMLELAELRGLEAQALDSSAQLQLEPDMSARASRALDKSGPAEQLELEAQALLALDMLELVELRGLEARALDKSAQLRLEPVERQALAVLALDMSELAAGLAAQPMGPRLRLEYIHLAPARKARLPRRLALMLRPNRQP